MKPLRYATYTHTSFFLWRKYRYTAPPVHESPTFAHKQTHKHQRPGLRIHQLASHSHTIACKWEACDGESLAYSACTDTQSPRSLSHVQQAPWSVYVWTHPPPLHMRSQLIEHDTRVCHLMIIASNTSLPFSNARKKSRYLRWWCPSSKYEVPRWCLGS